MAEENRTLDTFYQNWKLYQDHVKEAIAPLTEEQLALRAAPHLRSIGQIATHIITVRASWFTYDLHEHYEGIAPILEWGEPDAPARTAAELLIGLDLTWQMMADALARWNSDDMAQTFAEEENGTTFYVSRSWVIWHLIEHDLHHGGEISLTLGMHGLQAPHI